MATATKFRKFCFLYNSSLTNSTQFGNDSNYSKFNEGNIATNCSRVTVLALDGLTKKHFGHYAILKIFSLRSPSMSKWIVYHRFTHICRIKGCGGAAVRRCGGAGCPPPPPIIFERLKLPQLIIYRRKENLNKGECNLNQSKDGSFVKRVAKNNS